MADVTAQGEDQQHRPFDQIAVIKLPPVVGAHVTTPLAAAISRANCSITRGEVR